MGRTSNKSDTHQKGGLLHEVRNKTTISVSRETSHRLASIKLAHRPFGRITTEEVISKALDAMESRPRNKKPSGGDAPKGRASVGRNRKSPTARSG